jgi:hypothetical protein
MALSRIGQGAISSLSDIDNISITCNVHYQQAVDWVLREREWKDAKKRTSLSTPDGVPAFGWTQYYNVPTDSLRVLDVRASSLEDYAENDTMWSSEGDKIMCEVDDGIKVKYLYRMTVTDIPSHVIQVISVKLAHLICLPITSSTKLRDDLYLEYKDQLKEAAALDGMQGRSAVLRSSNLVKVRNQNQALATKYV